MDARWWLGWEARSARRQRGQRRRAGRRVRGEVANVEVSGGPDGIVVARKGGEPGDWLCDLWLAERLASA